MSEAIGSDRSMRTGVNDLHDMLDQRIGLLVAELHAGGWQAEEVLLAINDVLKTRWIDRLSGEKNTVPPTMAEDFVSDGNEG